MGGSREEGKGVGDGLGDRKRTDGLERYGGSWKGVSLILGHAIISSKNSINIRILFYNKSTSITYPWILAF